MSILKGNITVNGNITANNISTSGTISGTLPISANANNIITQVSGSLYADVPTNYKWVRQKIEVYYSGISFDVTSTQQNFISLIKGFTPTTGGPLGTFFNTTSNKLNVYNVDHPLFFKINLIGTWGTSSSNLGMQLLFSSTQGNNLNTTRNPQATTDIITFSTFFSVNSNGNLVTNGTPIMISTFSSTFTVTSALIVVDQLVHTDSVLSVV